MTLIDFSFCLQWWLVLTLIGLLFLPLTVFIFHNFFDRGYIFSKVIGLVLITYLVWILGSLRILTFNNYTIYSIIGSFLLINLYIAFKTNFLNTIKKYWIIFLFEELLFLAGLFFWSFVKAHEPSIHGLEKYMDFGFINSILRTDYFPPKDLWLSPGSINYYYFGHIIVALLTKLSLLASTVTFNLMVATLFAITLVSGFSIGGNLVFQALFNESRSKYRMTKVILFGLIAAFLLALGGNLHTIYAFFQNYNVDNPVPFWQLKLSLNSSGYWYPNATRFIPYTIHEFPIYSFVVSDLHGHVLDIPIALLTIAILISFFFTKKINLSYPIGIGFLISVMMMTNILDAPIYLLAFAIVLFFKNRVYFWKGMLISLVLSVIFSLPFWLNFKPFGSGIGLLCAPDFLISMNKLGPLIFEKDHCARSPLWMLLILYGFPYALAAGFLIKLKKSISQSDKLILLFLIFSTILLTIPEFVYIKDIYPLHYRANTVFKFHFQAFMFLALASSYMLFKILRDIKISLFNIAYLPLVYFLSMLIVIYPYFAIKSYYGDLKNYQGLNGLAYLYPLYPSDTDAITWIRQNIKGQPVILEATGDSYTDYARVSANTGLPTVLGWYVHEWLWRGNTAEENIRVEDVRNIYQSTDLDQTSSLIKKYNISLVFTGTLEKQKYPDLNENKFNNLGKVIFEEGNTKIFKIN